MASKKALEIKIKDNRSNPEWLSLSYYEQFSGLCSELSMILNPTLCENFLMITNRYVTEEIAKERAKTIDPFIQELEKDLKAYKKNIDDAKRGRGPGGKMLLDYIVAKIKKHYGE